MSTDWLTIGVEEEYQILDSDGHLQPFIDALMSSIAHEVGADQVRPEMIQSVVEVGTTVCQTVGEAKEQLARFRAMLNRVLEPVGMRIACAGTHPFSRWQDQQITEKERY
nr:glutamate-cysteine ligase family protein [Candidatus Dormibacteraeota bacterium]